MEDTKPWWQSRTIWASVLQIALGLAVSMGLISGTESTAILASAPDLIVGFVTSALGGWSLYARARASAKLTIA